MRLGGNIMHNDAVFDFLAPTIFHRPIANAIGLPETSVLVAHQKVLKCTAEGTRDGKEIPYEMTASQLKRLSLGKYTLKELRAFEKTLIDLGILSKSGKLYTFHWDALDRVVQEHYEGE